MQLCSLYTYMSPNLVPPKKGPTKLNHFCWAYNLGLSFSVAMMQDVSALRWASDRLRSSKVSVMAWGVMDFFQLVGMKSIHWGAPAETVGTQWGKQSLHFKSWAVQLHSLHQ